MKIKLIFLAILMFAGLFGSPLKAQNLIVNGTFDINTPSNPNCNLSPFAWQTTTHAIDSPLTAVQWTNVGHTSWWIDITDCSWGNGRWVKQTVPTVIGQTYIIGLNLLAPPWAPSGVDVFLDGTPVAHFDNTNNGTPSISDWERFEFCWTATSTSTEFKLLANSSVDSLCPVIGIDSVVMIPRDSLPFVFTLSNKCVPAVIGYQTTLPGHSVWYYNGSFLNSGAKNINASNPGTYRLKYVTVCGDTISKDTVVIECDTCKPVLNIQGFCEGKPTNFAFDFSRYCANTACIGSVTIVYGDVPGAGGTLNAPGPFNFSHTYALAGTYSITYCWTDLCTGKTKCSTATVVIEDCYCPPVVDIKKFCLGDVTTFEFMFDPECENCIEDMSINYGDGSNDISGSPYSFGHVYAFPGTYTVTYCWFDNCQQETFCETIVVVIAACSCEPLENVQQFCLGRPTNFAFTFDPSCEECVFHMTIDYGDGQSSAGGAPYNFSHTYGAAGVYTVTYCWSNSCTQQSYCKTITITIVQCPCDEPTEEVQYFCAGAPTNFQVDFGPCLNCIGSMTIDYGDGLSESIIAPFNFSHIYSTPGTYTVTYCWVDLCKQQSFCKTITVIIVECSCEPTPNIREFCLGQTTFFDFFFDEACLPCIGQMTIDFGDQMMMVVPGPPHSFQHNYPTPGSYTVTYCWVNTCTGATTCLTETIYIWDCENQTEPAPNAVTETLINSISLFPNPAQNKVMLRGIAVEMGVSRVVVLSVDGKQMLSLAVKAGVTEVEIPLDKLSSGTYLIRVEGEQTVVNLKLIKE